MAIDQQNPLINTTSSPYDPLFVDVYAQDANGKPNWAAFVGAGYPWCGAILKCTEGTYYNGGEWFRNQWSLVRAEARDRYGALLEATTPFLRGAYHYWKVSIDPIQQADFYLTTVQKASGWGSGDLAIVDVETAGNGNPSASQIVDSVSAYVERIVSCTGKKVILYGGSFLYDHGITSRMGCSALWIARYTKTLPENVITRIGWSEDSLAMWQFRGDLNNAQLTTKDDDTYPDHAPGIGVADLSVVTYPGGLEGLRTLI